MDLQEIYLMVLDYLHVTYTPDPSTVSRLHQEIRDGLAYIQRYVDPEASCLPGSAYAGLLCEYVMRAEAGALDTFSTDFSKEIHGGAVYTSVEKYVEVMGYGDEESEG